jgi:hypothetical protein
MGIEPLGGSGRKLFISTSFGVSFPFDVDVEPEVWPGLGPWASGEALVDMSVECSGVGVGVSIPVVDEKGTRFGSWGFGFETRI